MPLTSGKWLVHDYLSPVLKTEIQEILDELGDGYFALSFDETPLGGWNNFCCTITFVNKKGDLVTKVINLVQFKGSLEEKTKRPLSNAVIDTLTGVLGLDVDSLRRCLIVCSDGAELCQLGKKRLTGRGLNEENAQPPMLPNALPTTCKSHTIDRVAATDKKKAADGSIVSVNRLMGKNAEVALNHLNAFFNGHSTIAREEFVSHFQMSIMSINETRWYNTEEFLAVLYPVEDCSFAQWLASKWQEQKTGFTGVHAEALFKIFCPEALGAFNETLLLETVIEIALVIDFSEPLRKACYTLETDGPCAILATKILEMADQCINDMHPNIQWSRTKRLIDNYAQNGKSLSLRGQRAAAAVPQFSAEEITDQWRKKCTDLARPAKKYWDEKVFGHSDMPVFEALTLVNPNVMRYLVEDDAVFDAAKLDDKLKPLLGTLLDEPMLEKLKTEMSIYKTRAKMTASFQHCSIQDQLIKIVDFWRPKSADMKTWRQFAHRCFLVRTSSASVERAFSILKYIYGTNMRRSKADLTRLKLMMRFNHSTPKLKSFRGTIQMQERAKAGDRDEDSDATVRSDGEDEDDVVHVD